MKVYEIFQPAYDWFKNLSTPSWLKELGDIVDNEVREGLLTIGQHAVSLIKSKIIELAKENISNTEKFKRLFEFVKSIGVTIKDSVLTVILNGIVLALKRKQVI